MYTLIIMKKNSTDSSPKTVHLSLPVIVLMLVFFFGVPVAGYFIFYKVIAPQLYAANLIETTETKRSLLSKLSTTQEELTTLKTDHQKIKDILEQERKQRAESEARATIAETAKTVTGQQIANTENELVTLQRKVAFYENLLKPNTEKERLQCFNISASYSNGKVRYGVSFLKNDPKDRTTINVNTKLRILPATATDVSRAKYPTLSTRNFSLSKDYRLSGTLNTTLDTNTLHILDIQVQDAQNNMIAKCWQSL